MTATAGRLRVVYLGGTGRSGSTLVARALGSAPGVASAGEVRFAWQRGVLERRVCGCGTEVPSCPVWSQVLTGPDGAPTTAATAAAQHARLADATRMRTLPAWLAGRPPAGARAAADALAEVLHRFAAATGSDVVVDSSKLPTSAALLQLAPTLDVRVVHLVRDPRGTAFSWQRQRATGAVAGHDEPMDRFGPLKASLLWDVWNGALPRLVPPARLLTVRYEDLMSAPARWLGAMLDHADAHGRSVPFVDERTLDLGPSHTVAGNPGRLRHGPTTLRADAEWRDALPAADRRVVDLTTLPLRRRHGYR